MPDVRGGVRAMVPDHSGQIHACYSKHRGVLRAIDTAKGAKCRKKSEMAIAWNQKGDPGAKGDKGDTGAKGDKGDTGAKGDKGDPGGVSTVYTSLGHVFLTGATYTLVTRLDLPAGQYLLSGKGQALNQQETSDVVSCNVYEGAGTGGFLDACTVTVPRTSLIEASSYGTLAFQRAVKLAAPTSIRVECIDGQGTDGIGVTVRLSAMSVGAIIDQP